MKKEKKLIQKESAEDIFEIAVDFKKITNLYLKLIDLPQSEISKISADSIHVLVNPSLELDTTQSLFIITVSLKYEIPQSDPQLENLILLEFKTALSFYVKDISSYISATENTLHVPEPVMQDLIGISISTIRGILHMSTAGHFLHAYPLPLLDVDHLLGLIRAE